MIAIRLDSSDEQLIKSYAHIQGISVSEVVRRAILEKIEDEFDLKIAEKAKEDFDKGDKKTYTPEEINKELFGDENI